jgi:hypothetical protein
MNYRGVKISVFKDTSRGQHGYTAIPDIAGKEYFSTSKAKAVRDVKHSIDAEFSRGYSAIDQANRDFVRRNPLSKNEKYAAYAAVGGAVILGGALIYHFSKPPSTSGGSASWKRVPTGGLVQSGSHVRISVTQLDFQQFAATLGLPNTLAGFGDYINSLHVAPSVKLYGYVPPPGFGPQRPADWPTDDVDVATEYSADFTYTGAVPYPVVNGINTWVLS